MYVNALSVYTEGATKAEAPGPKCPALALAVSAVGIDVLSVSTLTRTQGLQQAPRVIKERWTVVQLSIVTKDLLVLSCLVVAYYQQWPLYVSELPLHLPFRREVILPEDIFQVILLGHEENDKKK